MSLFGKNPSPGQRPSFSPSERLRMMKSAPQAPKQEVKGLFDGRDLVSLKDIRREAEMRRLKHQPIAIPGTGGQRMWPEEYKKLLEKRLPSYGKTGTGINLQERKNILRQMRKEDGGTPSRDRRVLEEQWGLKGKYN